MTHHDTRSEATRGNTRSRRWCLTINNFTSETEEKITKEEKYIYQVEETTHKTPHLQVFLEYKNARTFTSIKNKYPTAHIEKTKGTLEDNINYCSKQESRIRGPYSNFYEPLKDPIENPYEWQKQVIELTKKTPDDRSIYWYYEEKGNTGKTSLCKHICINNDRAIYVSGKANDIKYAISCMEPKPKIILIDLPRSKEGYISYSGIEEIKNGIFFNNKYESKQVIYNCPHVICFANWLPDTTKLSEDRWKIININGGGSPPCARAKARALDAWVPSTKTK